MRKKIKQAAAWLLTTAMVFSGGISNGVSAWAETAGAKNALASPSNANRVSMKTNTASASDSSKENDFVTASSSDAVKISLASASDSVEYTQEFLTAEGILITIESDDSIWSDETTIEVTKVSSSDVTKMNNLVASELGERQSVFVIYAYDITFYDDGEEFEPDGTIKVTFSLPEELTDASSEAEIFHVNDAVTKVDLMETILEEENTWSCIAEGFSVYGVAVTASSYTEIYTVEDLQNIKYNLGSTYYLMNDIDLSGIDWSPIEYRSESRSDQFYGTFDGQGYTISGLSLTIDNNQSSSSEDNTVYAGLFGDIAGTIKNLNISDFSFNITSNVNGVGSCTYVGCITSGLANGSIENCHVSDSEIQVVTDTGSEIGGIAGYNHSGTISNCSFDGEITHKLSNSGSQYTYMGGICGNIGSANSYIEKCINYGSITGKSSNSSTNLCIGGVLGGSFIMPCNIDQCANYGDVVAEADPAYEGYGYAEAGGIVGSLYTNAIYDDNVITNSYNAGSISAESTLSDSIYCCTGGIVGYSVPSVEITSCYNLAEISGEGYSGSLIGYLAGSEISKCAYNYYYKESCVLALGGAKSEITLNAVSCLLFKMKIIGTYEGFDFDNIWEMGADDYPYPIFQWQDDLSDTDISVETYKIVFKKDNFSFINSSKYITNYYKPGRWISYLLELEMTVKEEIVELLEKGNFGDCFGMSMVACLNKLDIIHPEYWQQDATELYDLLAPKESNMVASLVDFYQVLQKLPEFDEYMKVPLTESEEREILQNLVDKAKGLGYGEIPIVMNFALYNGESVEEDKEVSGHAVLIYSMIDHGEDGILLGSGKQYQYECLVLDPNYAYAQRLYVNSDYTKWHYTNDSNWSSEYTFNSGKGKAIIASGFNDIDLLTLVNLETGKKYQSADNTENNSSKITSGSFVFTVENMEGNKALVDGLDVSGDLEAVPGVVSSYTAEGDSADEMYLFLDHDQAIQYQSGDENETSVSVRFSDLRLSAKSSTNNPVYFDPNGYVQLADYNENYQLGVTVNIEKNLDMPWYSFHVSGLNGDSPSLEVVTDGIIFSSSNMDDIVVTASDFTEETSLIFSTDKEEVLITKNNDGTALEIMIDSDGNGTYDTSLSDAEESNNEPSSVISDTRDSDNDDDIQTSGQWIHNSDGTWKYLNGGDYITGWAYIKNPYANTVAGQSDWDWFHFGIDGIMNTGWFTDEDGRSYYLNPLQDGTQGRMLTGWQWIKGEDGLYRSYYFETESNGYKGSLYRSTETPDGYLVNEMGARMIDGKEVTKDEEQ